MVAPSTELHFVMFPLMAQGHIVPMVDIARILAEKGATVTIFATPLVANRFRPVISRAIEAKLKIQILELELQVAKVGLPEGCQSFEKLPSSDSSAKLFAAMDLLEQPAEDLVRKLSPPPDCIISDFLFPWTTDMARRFNIPRLVFHGPGCFWLVCMHAVFSSDKFKTIKLEEKFMLPGLPDQVEVTKLQITGTKEIKPEQMGFWVRATEAEKAAYGTVVHTFYELEPEYVKEYSKVKDTKVWCIGPVALSNKANLDIAERGNKAAINEHDCLKWLDEKEPGSVFYVCLGSITRLSTEQAIEIALGLESTNQPFLWFLRNKTQELEKWFSEVGFEERVKDRGLIVHGWAPQILILSHCAVGGFLTHCGWNSTLEGVSFGVPMVTWPHFADQFLNETFIVEILKIGVRIGVDIPELYGEEDKLEALVKKEDVKRAVECLMDKEDKEAKQRRKRARKLAEMAKRAMAEEVGFEERVKDRGLIVHGWAPQILILSHRAVGGFLTHCGWNSTLEGVSFGVPMVTWPHFADQFLNETFIVEILKIGVRIGVEIPELYGEEDKLEALVKKEDVKRAVECLMDKEDKEAKQRRKRARKLAEMAKRAMAEGGSSYVNVSSLIQDITEFRNTQRLNRLHV
ncbi:UDP-glycosyltransferase 73E1 [Artemisia annua]|uniref:UDP-glycosyltransferase 73E1 n=1 Tax=Artemisia annua TaxID=35608 RepID=A0A2U1KLR0_ARTAN|nr:UDP-glycosyltransferase 73E1 [Artemisia annua]